MNPRDVQAAAAHLNATLDAIWNAERTFLAEVSATLSAMHVDTERALRSLQSSEYALRVLPHNGTEEP